jgi:hypothetical protein
MVTPAILAGLIAGYTVGAIVTAFAVAYDDQLLDLPMKPALATSSRRTGVCARMVSNRSVKRCLHSLDSGRTVSSPRR